MVAEAACVVEGKPVVVPARQGDILHPRLPGDAGDGAAVELIGGEAVFQPGIFLHRDLAQVLDPLSLTQLGIEPPVDEHAIAELFEAGHAGFGDSDCHKGFLSV